MGERADGVVARLSREIGLDARNGLGFSVRGLGFFGTGYDGDIHPITPINTRDWPQLPTQYRSGRSFKSISCVLVCLARLEESRINDLL